MKDKVVIITGASSGIGESLVKLFDQHGYAVVLAARSEQLMFDIQKQLPSYIQNPEKHLVVKTDVTQKNECKRLIDKTLEKYGRIDVLINNAGVSMRALFHETKFEVMEHLMNINFWGAVYCSQFALEAIKASKGSIVGVSSIAGYVGLPGRVGYSASKFALQGFLEVLRTENYPFGIHVLTACPGFTQSKIRKSALRGDGTPQAESPRNEQKMMHADVVAKKIYKAILGRRRDLILTFTGWFSVVLHKAFPRLTDYLLYKYFLKEANSVIKHEDNN